MISSTLDRLIRVIPDWPIPGVMFQDLTGVFADPQGLAAVTKALAEPFAELEIDLVAGMEARGFIVGATVASFLGVGFVPLRKPGKLPGAKHSVEYSLEYGTATLEVHHQDIPENSRVLIVDDVLATGGTAKAAVVLIEQCNAEVVGLSFILALEFLQGHQLLSDHTIRSLKTITA